MDTALIKELRCPYCGDGFRVLRSCLEAKGQLRYGLLECRCFTFPVVDGILLLNLSKGSGDAQEVLQPYVPLQVAAIRALERDDVAGLQAWIRRHMPLAAELIDGTDASYLNVATRFDLAVAAEAEHYLASMGRYEVLGTRGRDWIRWPLSRLRRRGLSVSAAEERAALASYYVARFFSPRVNALALHLGSLPIRGTILSLCCGHGMFENLLRADGRAARVVSVDGLFLNLLIARRYAGPDGIFICHDLQFPLPFTDGFFDGVFSSSCLPEIPAQRSFATEAIRVTAARGWTVFDSVWNLELGVHRIDRKRHYRFCQNFFSSLDSYLPFFCECAKGRVVGLDIAGLPDKYLTGPTWILDAQQAAAMADRSDPLISFIVFDRERFAGFVEPRRPWLTAEHLSISPVYAFRADNDHLHLQRHPGFSAPRLDFVPRAFAGYPDQITLRASQLVADPRTLTDAYVRGYLALLPGDFAPRITRKVALASDSSAPPPA